MTRSAFLLAQTHLLFPKSLYAMLDDDPGILNSRKCLFGNVADDIIAFNPGIMGGFTQHCRELWGSSLSNGEVTGEEKVRRCRLSHSI